MKKNILIVCSVISVGLFTSCAEKEGQYIDLGTGKSINVVMDEKTGAMVNADTKDPLYIYVDTKKHDTIYAINGAVINGQVIKTKDNKFVYENDEKLKIENGQVKYKDGDYKVEVEKDGDVKIKNGDEKVKIDGKTGERKTKKDD